MRLVPKQMSTGDRTILGRISKRGNGYLRTLFMQAARVILLRPASWPKDSFGSGSLAPHGACILTLWTCNSRQQAGAERLDRVGPGAQL